MGGGVGVGVAEEVDDVEAALLDEDEALEDVEELEVEVEIFALRTAFHFRESVSPAKVVAMMSIDDAVTESHWKKEAPHSV